MVNFLTLNVNGLRNPLKRSSLLLWLAAVTPSLDLICLQETHSTSEAELQSWFSSSKYSAVGSHLTNHSAGVCILYKSSFNVNIIESDISGRYIVVDFKSCLHDFRVICIYASNRYLERGPFFEDLSRFSNCNVPVLFLGDFNSVFDRSLDRSDSPIVSSPRDTSDKLIKLFADFNVVDVWRGLVLMVLFCHALILLVFPVHGLVLRCLATSFLARIQIIVLWLSLLIYLAQLSWVRGFGN